MSTPLQVAAAPQASYGSMLINGAARVAQGMRAERVRLRDFFAPAWTVVNPGIPYIPNWHNDLIAEHLEAVHSAQIKLLDIEMPPRMGKSFHVTVAFGPWEWTEDASERFLFSSYGQKLCNRHSLDRRKIILSAWYKNRWGEAVRLADDQNLKTEFQNTAGGHMITAPFGSSATGSGGRRLVIDDPINPKQSASKVQREAAHDFYRGTLTTRLDDEQHSAQIIVAQRTDVDDIQGKFVREKDGWVILKIPMQAPRRMVYTFPVSKREKVYEKGELLCEARKSQKGVDALRKALGSHRASAQLDQEPESATGNLFPRNQWKPLRVCPLPLFMLTIWDTASKEKQQNDPSAGVTIVKHEKGYHFCKGVFNDQVRFGVLKVAVSNKYQLDKPDAIFIEDKSSGQQLIQELQDTSDIPILRFDFQPDDKSEEAAHWRSWFKMDKHARASLVQPLWEAGLISYDPDMENAAEMIEQFAKFPKVDHDDIVDAGVHGVRYLSRLDTQEQPEDNAEEGDDINDGL